MRKWMAAIIVLLLLAVAVPAGATSYIRLTPGEVLKEARMVAIGRVSGALPAWEEGEGAIFNGMVLDVEAYLQGAPGPAQLQVRLMGGQVCDWKNECRAIVGGMEGKQMVGQRMLVALQPNENGNLEPVGGPNGLVRLTETGLALHDQTQSEEDVKAWEQFLKAAEQRKPDPGATAPGARPAPGTGNAAPPAAAPGVTGPGPGVPWVPLLALGAGLLALAGAGLWWRRRRMGL